MSVFFDNRGRQRDHELGAPGLPAARNRRSPHVSNRPRARDGDAPLWGVAYDRIEGVVHLLLAFTIVGGAAAILSSALFSPGAPLGGTSETPAESARAGIAPAIAGAATKDAAEAVAPVRQAEQASAAPGLAPTPATSESLLDARPMAETASAPAAMASAPEPLAPPSADMREKLVARQDAAPPTETRAEAVSAPAVTPKPEEPAVVETPADEMKTDEGGRTAKCYLKLSGRVQSSGACKVTHTGGTVVFHLPGKPLEIVQQNGRVWTATLGGRSLGKVYRNKSAPCWGARGFYACENG